MCQFQLKSGIGTYPTSVAEKANKEYMVNLKQQHNCGLAWNDLGSVDRDTHIIIKLDVSPQPKENDDIFNLASFSKISQISLMYIYLSTLHHNLKAVSEGKPIKL